MKYYQAQTPAQKKLMLNKHKQKNAALLEDLKAQKDAIVQDLKSASESNAVERDMIAREYGQLLADYMEYGQDYVLKQYHGGIALINLLQGLQSSSAEEKAYWSKIALEQMDKAEMRKFRRSLEEDPGGKIKQIEIIERVIVDAGSR
jgi:hypothetical protein